MQPSGPDLCCPSLDVSPRDHDQFRAGCGRRTMFWIADLDVRLSVATGSGGHSAIRCPTVVDSVTRGDAARSCYGIDAMRSISNRAPGTSKPVVPTVVRGGGVGKNSFQTSSNSLKSRRSIMNTCALTTFSREVPAALNVRA